MRSHDILPYLVTLFVIIGAIATGPIFTPQKDTINHSNEERIAEGKAEVTIEDPPDENIGIRKSSYDTRIYTLELPSTVIYVKNVTGKPLVSYKVQIVELGYAQTEIAILQPGVSDRVRLSFSDISFSRNRITDDSYAVELSIVLRASGEKTLFYRNETIQVQH